MQKRALGKGGLEVGAERVNYARAQTVQARRWLQFETTLHELDLWRSREVFQDVIRDLPESPRLS
jgi:hypothetical protein